MHHRLFALILLLTSYCAQAQFPSNESKWGIIFSPALVMAPGISLALQPGVEYRLSERFYLLGDVALPVATFEKDSTINRHYTRIKAEVRYLFSSTSGFLKRRKGKGLMLLALSRLFECNSYIGLQTSFAFRNFRDLNGFHYISDRTDTIVTVYDRADIRSNIFTYSLQLGSIYEISKNFSIDAFFGIGGRTINTSYTDVVNPYTKPYPGSRTPFLPSAYRIPGSVTRLHLNAGYRLIYRFN